MLDKNTMIEVTNRNAGVTGYKIPDLGNLRRQFAPKETKEISMEELRKLSYIPGGKTLLTDYLVIKNEEALKELLSQGVEPEYFYTENEIQQLLLTGTLAQLEDFLDFAPDGALEIMKKLAVSLELNDVAKREAIFKKTGFNVTNAIDISKVAEESIEEEVKVRRAEPISTGRRTAPPAYKVTSISK